MAITREEALSANVFHQRTTRLPTQRRPAEVYCRIWRRNGVTKTWKRDLTRISVPVRYGMYKFDHIVDITVPELHTEANCPFAGR